MIPVEMPRGRRKQTVESNEEYLSEDHVVQKNSQKTLAHESDSEMEEESFARVYVEPQNQEFKMVNEKTYSQREQEAKEYKDLQPTSRNTSTIHKFRSCKICTESEDYYEK
eukprot:XP_008662834.1 uncharacterized protein LOC103641250 [Zea mays]